MRVELYSSGNRIIAPENQNFYNVSITMHGLLMIFFLVMPGLFGDLEITLFLSSMVLLRSSTQELTIFLLFY